MPRRGRGVAQEGGNSRKGEDGVVVTETSAIDTLFSFVYQHASASILKSAHELNIFDTLEEEGGPWTAEKLAAKLGYHGKTTSRLLNALTAIQLLEKEAQETGDVYSNSESGKLLVAKNPHNIRELVSWLDWFADDLKKLPKVVKEGAPEGGCSSEGLEPLKPSDVEEMTKCEHGHRHDTDGNTFDEHGKLLHGGAGGAKTESNSDARNTKDAKEMEKCKHGNYHDKDGTVYDETGKKIHGPGGSHEQGVKTGHGQGEGADEEGADSWDSYESYQTMFNLLGASAPKLVTAVDLSAHKSAVDLGGGPGALCFALKRQYPDMDVTLFELDHVIEMFNERFVAGNENLNVKTVAGDWNKTPLPKAELYILSQIVHDIGNPDELLRKVYDAIEPGGGLLLLEQTLADDKVSVVAAAVWDVIMMAHGGVLRSPAEFRVWLRDVGFEDVRVVRTQEHNECDVIYAKKPERADRKKSKK